MEAQHLTLLRFLSCVQDLKPENILLKSPNKSTIKLIGESAWRRECIAAAA